MAIHSNNPLIVQSDHTVLVEVDSPRYEEARDLLIGFAELVKSPEHVHTYRITPLSIWNATAAGMKTDHILGALREYSKYELPYNVETEIRDYASRYGRLQLLRHDHGLILRANDIFLAEEIHGNKLVEPFLSERLSELEFLVDPLARGRIKQVLVQIGFPPEDLAGYTEGEPFSFSLKHHSLSGNRFALRPYQLDAANAFHAGGSVRGGSGVIVLPCGAGKTIVGMACMHFVQSSTLILTTCVSAVRQWKAELLDKTSISEDEIGEYTGEIKEFRPITVSTYQLMTYRRNRETDFVHLSLFDQRNWGLIIYDEVHLLPAPVFQVTAGLQARRRLGLTATLVREDGRENDVFALIGPKKADVPWKILEHQGWIAKAVCTEIRLPLPEGERMAYAVADARLKFRIASENYAKHKMVTQVLEKHPDESAIVIGTYIDQIKSIAKSLGIPVLTGSTAQKKRDQLYADFKEGHIQHLAVSKVANFAIDLPDASVAIQISGSFGSRQEEAQRLGRILRPKPGLNQAHFYTLVTSDSVEQDFAHKRQLFLCEQGYEYRIVEMDSIETPVEGSLIHEIP